jgi:hypothetical protein
MPLKKRTLFGLPGLAMALLVCSPKASAQDSPPAPQAAPQGQAQSKDEITAVPNRPTFASTGEVVQRGVFEIEYGFEAADGHQNINGLLKFGLFKNLELWFLNNPVERDAGLAGMGDSGAGFKWRIVPQKKARPTVSVLYVATLPTAKDVLGAGAVGHLVQLLVSKDFGKHHFDANFGPHFVGRPGAGGFGRHYFSSLSWSHPLRGKWSATAEIAGFSRTNAPTPATPATLTILAAPSYSVSSRLVLDAGAYVAVFGQLPRVTFFAGVTYSIAELYRRSSERKSARR